MKHIEIHVLRSVPVGRQNTDDAGMIKRCIFGGIERQRNAVQSYSRQMRLMIEKYSNQKLYQTRLRLYLAKKLVESGMADIDADSFASFVLRIVGVETKEGKDATVGRYDAKSLDQFVIDVMANKNELKDFQNEVVKIKNDNERKKKEAKLSKDVLFVYLKKTVLANNKNHLLDMFGRMFASDQDSSIQSCTMRSQMISTGSHRPVLDFFTALDDKTNNGAAHMGHRELSGGGSYYNSVSVDISDMLQRNDGDADLVSEYIVYFLMSILNSDPIGGTYSNFSSKKPYFVGVAMREKGSPSLLCDFMYNGIEKDTLSNISCSLMQFGSKTWKVTDDHPKYVGFTFIGDAKDEEFIASHQPKDWIRYDEYTSLIAKTVEFVKEDRYKEHESLIAKATDITAEITKVAGMVQGNS